MTELNFSTVKTVFVLSECPPDDDDEEEEEDVLAEEFLSFFVVLFLLQHLLLGLGLGFFFFETPLVFELDFVISAPFPSLAKASDPLDEATPLALATPDFLYLAILKQ